MRDRACWGRTREEEPGSAGAGMQLRPARCAISSRRRMGPARCVTTVPAGRGLGRPGFGNMQGRPGRARLSSAASPGFCGTRAASTIQADLEPEGVTLRTPSESSSPGYREAGGTETRVPAGKADWKGGGGSAAPCRRTNILGRGRGKAEASMRLAAAPGLLEGSRRAWT